MAAEISFLNGRAEAAFALRPAWWDVASEYTLDHVPNSAEMIKAAHLDWTVEPQPVYGADGRIIEGFSTTVRKDTGMHLGVMSDNYRVVQNHEAFRFLDSLLMDGVMKYESAGALRGGRTVWALARMPSIDTIAEGDDVARYVLWLNSHDGLGSLFAIPTSVRVVCANTAALAIQGQRGIRHIGDVSSKLKQAHALISQADVRFTGFRDKAQLLASRKYTKESAAEYLFELLPSPEKEGRSFSIHERKIDEIGQRLLSQRQQLPSIRGTWWSLYNAISEAIDHGRFFSNRGTGRTRAENRMMAVMMGPAADFKTKAFDLAVTMAS